MPWFGAWGSGTWFIFPMLMCIGMMVLMMVMGMGHMGGHSGGHTAGNGGRLDEPPTDPALDTLRQRFASGEITRQEYEEQRDLLLKV